MTRRKAAPRAMLGVVVGFMASTCAWAKDAAGLDNTIALRITPGTGLPDTLGLHLSYAPERWSVDVGMGQFPALMTTARLHVGAGVLAREWDTRRLHTQRWTVGPYLGLMKSWLPLYNRGPQSITVGPDDMGSSGELDADAAVDFGVQGTALAWRSERWAFTVALAGGISSYLGWGYPEVIPDLRLDFGVALRLPRHDDDG